MVDDKRASQHVKLFTQHLLWPAETTGLNRSSVHKICHRLRASRLREVFAELVKQDDTTTILVNLVKLLPCLSLVHWSSTQCQDLLELMEIQTPVVIIVDLIEAPEDLVEIKKVG